MKMKKGFVFGVALLTSLTVFSGCKEKKVEKVEVSSKVLIKASSTTSQEIDMIADFTSNVEAFQTNNICPSMPVRIDKISVDVGDKVKKGDLIAVMDQTQYNQTAVQVANLEADYIRLKAVYDAGGVSEQQLNAAETQLKVQKEALALLSDNIQLQSPINGVVTGRYFDPGDMFSMTPNASGSASILQIMQIDKLKVSINVSENYFPYVKLGMPVTIIADIYPNEVFEGEVSLIYPTIDLKSRTFTVEVTIPNSSSKLRPGMFTRSTIKLGSEIGVMVEDLAIQKQIGSNEKYVFVIKDGIANRVTVKTGRQIGKYINVTSGLEGGDVVAIQGVSKLADGTQVEIKQN